MALLHEAEEVALGAVFHDVVPASMVCAEADGLDNVGMVKALADAKFGLDFLFVFFLAFPTRLAAKLLDGVHLARGALAHHERDL